MGKKKVDQSVFNQMNHKNNAMSSGKSGSAAKTQVAKGNVTQHRSVGRGN